MKTDAARVLIAGSGSGCGKTTVTCALLQALKNRALDLAAFKCGPDYIDPMFHREILDVDSGNLDLFFCEKPLMRSLFCQNAAAWNVIEGVMGLYDGLTMESSEASSFEVAAALDAPIILTVNARGMALSAAALVKGFMEFKTPTRIGGVLLNHVSAASFPAYRKSIEQSCGVPVLGYLPDCPECTLESRHLGLVTAGEVEGLREKLRRLGELAEQCIDLDAVMALMQSAPPLEAEDFTPSAGEPVTVAVARDRAFCFYYRDNLALLERFGATLVYFSPLSDAELPECDGLWLGGGYPELYAEALSRNECMRRSVHKAVTGGLPTLAECGGFMYLCESLDGKPMVGAIPGGCRNTGHLVRFGYVTLHAEEESMLFSAGGSIKAHEFHYWEADESGDALRAEKPTGRSWWAAHTGPTLYAGFPHLYLPSAPEAAERFLNKCRERKQA